jgi:phage gp36-like protein
MDIVNYNKKRYCCNLVLYRMTVFFTDQALSNQKAAVRRFRTLLPQQKREGAK